MSFKREVRLSLMSEVNVLTLVSIHPQRTRRAWQKKFEDIASRSEPEEDSFLLGVQKPEPSNIFDFLEPPQVLDMKINSPPSMTRN